MTEWEKAQQKITIAWARKDFEAAFSEIDEILATETPAHKGQALLYRGMIKESQGDLVGAKQDWREALSLAPKGSYARYVGERSLGEACEKMGSRDEALQWYREALRTCAQGDDFSGGLALKAFLALKGLQLTPDDEGLAVSVAKKSWAVLELPGSPDLKDLGAAAATLATRASEP